MKNYTYIIGLFLFGLTACTEVIDVNLDSSREYLVVEGRLEHYAEKEYRKINFSPDNPRLAFIFRKDLQIITLTKSLNVFGKLNNNIFLKEKDAEVYIINEKTKARHTFTKTIPGLDKSQLGDFAEGFWVSVFQVEMNTDYTLHVITTINGKKQHYVATQRASPNPGIREVTQVQVKDNILYPDGYYAMPVVRGITDSTHIMWDVYHLPKDKPPVYVLPRADSGGSRRIRFVDGEETGTSMCGVVIYQYFKGQERVLGENEDEDDLPNPTQPGDAMLLKSFSMNRPNYVHALNVYLSARPNPDIPQGPVFGNVRALNADGTINNSEIALGFFSVHDIAVALRTIVEKAEDDPLASYVNGTDFAPVTKVCNNLDTRYTGGTSLVRYQDELFSEYSTTLEPYKTVGSTTLNVRVHQAKGDKATNRRAVFLAAGGSFESINHATLNSYISFLTARGYVVIEPDYTVLQSSKVTRSQYLTTVMQAAIDYSDAVRYAKTSDFAKRYRVNIQKTIIGGYSAGSVSALTLAYVSSADNLGELQPIAQSLDFFTKKINIDAVMNVSGGMTSSEFISQGEPKLFNIHGDKDTTIPFEKGEFTLGALKINMEGSSRLHSRSQTFGADRSTLFVVKNGTHISPVLNQYTVNKHMLDNINQVYSK